MSWYIFNMNNILGLDAKELQMLVQQEGEPPYRGSQLAEWIYRHGARTFTSMSNLPNRLQTKLAQKYEVDRSRVLTLQQSKDGSIKLLLEMKDNERIETVGLPYADRFSCCLSTQVGCPIGCIFCASGQGKFIRSLQPGEIVAQVLTTNEIIASGVIQTNSRSHQIDHVVIMGMGEPLLNYDSTIKAVRLLNNEVGIGFRHITISTVGIIPGILKLSREKIQVTLAISLHAPNDELRRQIIPGISNKWSITEIINASREYVRQTGRRVTFEYCLLDGLNDGAQEARELAMILAGLNCHVNLILYNPVPGLPFRTPSQVKVRQFRDILKKARIQVTQRVRRGTDIAAACGQLR
jgi:23S rRNA (adenine2503-C2)-methyltransferase